MNHPIVAAVEVAYKKKNIPNPRPGDIVRIHQKIKEGGKERIQVYEGVVIKRQHGQEMGATFTVRKIAVGGIGVERTFLLHTPTIVKIERLKTSSVRRAKLFYLRDTQSSKMKIRGEKTDHEVWEEKDAEEEIEKIKEEQEAEAQEKAKQEEAEQAELDKKFEQARGTVEENEKGDDTNGAAGGEASGDLPKEDKEV